MKARPKRRTRLVPDPADEFMRSTKAGPKPEYPFFKDAFMVAQLAAPLLAAGLSEEEALKRAYNLLTGSVDYLNAMDEHEQEQARQFLDCYSLPEAMKQMGVKSRRQFRDWFFRAFPGEYGSRRWRDLLACTDAISEDEIAQMNALRKEAFVARARKGREKKRGNLKRLT
jgi:CHASE3 domain sensor protein